MATNDINLQVRSIIKDCLQLPEVNIKDDENLPELLSINSIDAIGIFLMLEDIFSIQIDDEDLGVELIESINNIVNYINIKKSGGN